MIARLMLACAFDGLLDCLMCWLLVWLFDLSSDWLTDCLIEFFSFVG